MRPARSSVRRRRNATSPTGAAGVTLALCQCFAIRASIWLTRAWTAVSGSWSEPFVSGAAAGAASAQQASTHVARVARSGSKKGSIRDGCSTEKPALIMAGFPWVGGRRARQARRAARNDYPPYFICPRNGKQSAFGEDGAFPVVGSNPRPRQCLPDWPIHCLHLTETPPAS